MSNSDDFASISLTRGEKVNIRPKIIIKRSKDGRSGKAFFIFELSEIKSEENKEGFKEMIMRDKEGEIITKEIKIHLKDGKRQSIEAIYRWKSTIDFKRFIRFANNYANSMKPLDSKE